MTAPTRPAEPRPPPPGSLGLPFVGNTVAFLKDPGAFLDRQHREHGPIFKMRILGETIVALSSPDAIKLLLDESIVAREGASPPHLQALLNPTALPFIDGDRHRKKGRPEEHGCGGEALADLMMKVFAVHTLRAHTWELAPDQRLDAKPGTLFPSPRDGLRVSFRTSR